MRITALAFVAAAAAVSLGAGCTAPNTFAQPSMADASEIAAVAVRPSSEVAFTRAGSLSPDTAAVRVAVLDARITLHQAGAAVSVPELSIALADVDLPPTALAPAGVKLRQQHLDVAGPSHVTVLERDGEVLAVELHGPFKYGASLVLDDGTLYPIGARDGIADDVDVRAVRDAASGRVTVTASAAPAAHECWAASDLLTLSDCSLYVEADAEMRP
jgi:hypothetical protein